MAIYACDTANKAINFAFNANKLAKLSEGNLR